MRASISISLIDSLLTEERLGERRVVPTRYFLAKPKIGEEMHIFIEQGKLLLIKLLAIGPINPEKGTRECCASNPCLQSSCQEKEADVVWCRAVFELNGEVRATEIEDRDAAIEHVAREKASSEVRSLLLSLDRPVTDGWWWFDSLEASVRPWPVS